MGKKAEQVWAKIGECKLWLTWTVKLLGLSIYSRLKYDHLRDICMKANRKLSVLARVREYLDIDTMRISFKTFFESQFKYCLLTWISCSRTTKKKKERERILINCWKKDGLFNVQHYNTRTTAIEMLKVYYSLFETSFSDLFFRQENTYNFCRNREFQNTVWNDSNSIRHFEPVTWDLVS